MPLPPTDFWHGAFDRPLRDEGDGRSGRLFDPFGHRWCIGGPEG